MSKRLVLTAMVSTLALSACSEGVVDAIDTASAQFEDAVNETFGLTGRPRDDEPVIEVEEDLPEADLVEEISVLEANKATMVAALTEAFGDHDVTAIDRYFAEPYIQHNPISPSGLEPLRGLVSGLAEGPAGEVDIHRVIGEGDLVATHATYYGFGPVPLVAFDVFRFNEDGKIVEHWDNMTAQIEGVGVSGRTQTDGVIAITDLDQTEANKAVVEDFITRAFINGEQVDFTQHISPVSYAQHNPDIGDGLEGLGQLMAYLGENEISFFYTDLHFAIAEGNFVLTASEGVFGDAPTAFYDLFRLEDGLIVEHWDVIADMPGEDVPEGYPGKF